MSKTIDKIIDRNLEIIQGQSPGGLVYAFHKYLISSDVPVDLCFNYDARGKILVFDHPELKKPANPILYQGIFSVEPMQKRMSGIVPGEIQRYWVRDIRSTKQAIEVIDKSIVEYSEKAVRAGPITGRWLVKNQAFRI